MIFFTLFSLNCVYFLDGYYLPVPYFSFFRKFSLFPDSTTVKKNSENKTLHTLTGKNKKKARIGFYLPVPKLEIGLT